MEFVWLDVLIHGLIYILCLVVPGWAWLSLFGINHKEVWFFYPVASLGFFIALSVTFTLFSITPSLALFSTGYFLLVIGLVVLATPKPLPKLNVSRFFLSDLSGDHGLLPQTAVPLVVFLGVFIYGLVGGVYVEVPGDPLWHVGKINHASLAWRQQLAPPFNNTQDVFLISNYYWYHFCGWLIALTGVSLESALHSIWVVNLMVVTGCFYGFAKFVLNESTLNQSQRTMAASIAVLFWVFHFGIGPFSYLRYYTFAPSFLAFTGYWSTIVAVWCFFNRDTGRIKLMALSAVLGGTTLMLHQQEALFIAVMSLLLVAAMFLRLVFGAGGYSIKQIRLRLFATDSTRIVCLCMGLILVGYLLVHGYLYVSRVRNFALEGGWLTPMSDTLGIFKHLYVLKPDRQFYQVITVWGIWGYLMYALRSRQYPVPIIIAAGLWAPLWTVFNPVFIDLFLRVSWPEVVWRLSYLVPMELAMAFLVVSGGSALLRMGRPVKGARKTQSVCLLIGSVVLLLPLGTGVIANPYHKFAMLKSTPKEADYRLVSDLLEELNKYPEQPILTDQVTGYIINAFTVQQYHGHKFYGHGALNTKQAEYETTDFEPYEGGLLIINQRRGSASEIGQISGHWPTNIRAFDEWYSAEFVRFVESNDGMFTPLLDLNELIIYRVREKDSPESTG